MASSHPTSTNSGKRRKSDKDSLIDGIDDIPEDALAELEDALMLMDDDSPNATAVTGTSNRHAVALPEARHAHDRACFGNDFFVCCSPRKPGDKFFPCIHGFDDPDPLPACAAGR